MIEHENINAALADMKLAKRPYSAPALLVFGQVTALTRSASGCNMSDSAGCTSVIGSNMGVKASDRNAKENIIISASIHLKLQNFGKNQK